MRNQKAYQRALQAVIHAETSIPAEARRSATYRGEPDERILERIAEAQRRPRPAPTQLDERLTGIPLSIEHIIPESHGGTTTRENLWRSCRPCNEGIHIIGITAIGRATIGVLQLNRLLLVRARARWVAAGWHPPDNENR